MFLKHIARSQSEQHTNADAEDQQIIDVTEDGDEVGNNVNRRR